MKAVKWILIIGGGLAVLFLAVLVLAPMFIDVNKHKSEIEKVVSETAGRPFAIDGNIQLSLFPWAGFSLSELRLGNPDGFEEKDMVRISAFEVRVKLLPLISKNIQVNRFVLKNPRIVLIKTKKGRGNWEGLGPSAPDKTPSTTEPTGQPPEAGLPIKSLTVGELAVTGGTLLWRDEAAGTQNEVEEFELVIRNLSLERAVPLSFSARVDTKPVSAEGRIGPLSGDMVQGKLPIDLVIKAMGQVELALKGHLENPAADPQFDLSVGVPEFSPRKFMAALGKELPAKTADPKALNRLSFKARIKGNPKKAAIQNGTLILDDSTTTFTANIKDFSRPELWFNMDIDSLDADRYLPPEGASRAKDPSPTPTGKSDRKKKTDYTPLRRMILDGQMKIGRLIAGGAKMEKVRLTVKAKGGVIQISPKMTMYQGDVSGKTIINVTRSTPKTQIRLSAKNLQVNPLLKDVLNKDFLEGATDTRFQLSMRGDDADSIRKSLGGEGQLFFKDGAIKGIDLASMARNVKSAFGLESHVGPKPRTDFSELVIPFSIEKGLARTANARLLSPFIRIKAGGTANLVSETIDMRIDPKIVGTIKGQGDTMDRGGITVPVLVSGTFTDPRFEPDLAGMLTGGSGSSPEDVVKGFTGGKGDVIKDAEEQVKGLLKGLPFGQ